MSAKSHASCHGCGLCMLACPVWRQTRDVRLTPHGRAKALQNGATPGELRASIASCTLCGACEPVCPERIPLIDMILELRRAQPLEGETPPAPATATADAPSGTVFLPGAPLRRDPERVRRIAGLLDATIAEDDGADVAYWLEAGIALQPERLRSFLDSLDRVESLVVAEGLLLRKLREWLPGRRMLSLGEALSAHEAVRAKLRASDLYVIEPRAFHADHARLVGHYDSLAKARGISTNLDLQRLAVPVGASADQARWVLEGRKFERVVVEDAGDFAAFASATDRPVVHIGDL